MRTYTVTIKEEDPSEEGRETSIVIREDNLPTSDRWYVLCGRYPQIAERDRFETLVKNVRDAILDLVENEGEVSVRGYVENLDDEYKHQCKY